MRTIELIANDECSMSALRRDAIAELLKAGQSGCSQPAPAAAITISLHCWRDENGKLHCKLSVTLGNAT